MTQSQIHHGVISTSDNFCLMQWTLISVSHWFLTPANWNFTGPKWRSSEPSPSSSICLCFAWGMGESWHLKQRALEPCICRTNLIFLLLFMVSCYYNDLICICPENVLVHCNHAGLKSHIFFLRKLRLYRYVHCR